LEGVQTSLSSTPPHPKRIQQIEKTRRNSPPNHVLSH
jgi:hypothetical protein